MILRLLKPLKTKSFFLFGARGAGKTTFVKEQFLKEFGGNHTTIDLLDSEQEEAYSREPQRLEKLARKYDWIFIDEVQKNLVLLNHVHRMIEDSKQKFILSGSSARKLKHGGANLLGGRAVFEYLFPLMSNELGKYFDLDHALKWGGLPSLLDVSDEEKRRVLQAYTRGYLKEEILVEQLVRDVKPFRDFLEISAQCSGKIISYSKIGRDLGVDPKTVETYFQILEDTHIGFRLPAFHNSIRKSQKMHPKFYLFDLGVKRSLQRSLQDSLNPASYAYGDAFEHFVILEILKLNHYHHADYKMSYLRTKDEAEVDLILNRGAKHILIEIKSYKRVEKSDLQKLSKFKKDIHGAEAFLLSQDKMSFEESGVCCTSWHEGLKKIFSR